MVNNNEPKRKQSETPKFAVNTRSHGNALMGLPQAALLAPFLQPTNLQVRSLKPDGSSNYNASFLAVSHRSQTRRIALFTKINALLGDNMDAWHEALHRPDGLPANALDWSTVLLQ